GLPRLGRLGRASATVVRRLPGRRLRAGMSGLLGHPDSSRVAGPAPRRLRRRLSGQRDRRVVGARAAQGSAADVPSLPHGAAPADGHPPGLLRVVPPTGNGAHRCTDAEGTLTEGGRLMSWLDDDELDSDTSADPTAEEQPAGDGDSDDQEGTPLPYLDPDIAAEWDEEDDELPEWFGVRWRDIDVEHQGEAWVWLRRWVEWFADTYRLRRA